MQHPTGRSPLAHEKRLFPASWLLLCFVPFVVSCAATPTPVPQTRISLVGADSMQWMAHALADAYSAGHPTVTFSVQAANSTAGIGAAGVYSRTIGMVSRVIKPGELDQSRAVVVARDGVAIIVNQNNPINAIQRAQIAQVFAGEILSWPAGPDTGKNIVVVSREQGSGTRDAFETMVMNGKRVTLTAIVMPGEAAVVDYVAQHSDSIGYVSMGAVTSQVHALAVDDVPLSTQSVESQRYPLVRTLSFIVPLQSSPELAAFVDFALSPDGQAIIGQRYGRAPQ